MFLHKKKKNKKRPPLKVFSRLFIIIIVLFYLLSRMPPFFSQATNKTYVAEYGKIEAVVSTEGYIVRDEKVIKHLGEGEIVLLTEEGKKVRKGQKLATLHFNDLDEKTSKDLEIINLRIESIKDKQTEQQPFHKDIEKIESDIAAASREIQQFIKDGEYEKVYPLKENLSLLIEKKSIITGEKSFSGKNLEQLEQQRKSLQEKVSASEEAIYSEFPGIVAVGSDGLEDLLTLNNLEDFTLQEYETIKNSIKPLNANDDGDQEISLRIIQDHKWSIITTVKEKDMQQLEEGKSIKLRQRGESKEYKAVIRKIIHEDGEDAIIVLDLTEFMEEFYNKRVITFDMIKTSFEGIMIPNTAIIEQEGKQGVFRLDVNGFSRFIPVKIKGSNREYSIIYNGYFDESNNGENSRVNTINFYDEIVTNAEKISQGDRIR